MMKMNAGAWIGIIAGIAGVLIAIIAVITTTGGEPAALVVIDAVVRLLPGALGSETSAANESFSHGLLDCPQYTRPPDFEGMRAPEVLFTGNHAEIARWRHEASMDKTKRHRPDLLKE